MNVTMKNQSLQVGLKGRDGYEIDPQTTGGSSGTSNGAGGSSGGGSPTKD